MDGYGHKYFITRIIVLAPVIARSEYGLHLVEICQLSKQLRIEANVGSIVNKVANGKACGASYPISPASAHESWKR